MIRILIVFHSQSGNTRVMAEAVAKGVGAIEGAEAVLKKAADATEEDLIACDGLVIGSPEYFGYMAGAVKDLFDRTYNPLRGRKRIFRKPYAVFISAGNDGTGSLGSIEKICLGFQFKKIHQPLVSRGPVTEDMLAACEELGQTIAAGCLAGIY